MKTLLAVVMATSVLFAVLPNPEEGSKIESFLIQVTVDLVKDDNSTVTLLDNEFVETKSESNVTAVSDEIHKNLPASGTYVGVKYTVSKVKTKSKIVLNGTTYYTQKKEVNSGENWALTTDSTKADYLTMIPSFPDENNITFTKPLVISGRNATVYLVNKFGTNITLGWNGSDPEEDIYWVGEEQIFTGILPQEPKKEISFDINYTKGLSWKSNKLTILTDGNYSILGAHMSRPSMYALNGSFFKDGKDTEGGYEIDIHKADNSNSFFRINVDINCSGGTYTLQPIFVHDENAPGLTVPDIANSITGGYTLDANGSIQCKDITY